MSHETIEAAIREAVAKGIAAAGGGTDAVTEHVTPRARQGFLIDIHNGETMASAAGGAEGEAYTAALGATPAAVAAALRAYGLSTSTQSDGLEAAGLAAVAADLGNINQVERHWAVTEATATRTPEEAAGAAVRAVRARRR